MNTEYVIIPICIPSNNTDYLKVSNIPISIWTRDDETGRPIDTVKAEQEAMEKIAQIYRWTEGKISFAYGASTAGGIGDKNKANKANERIIEKLKQCTKIDYMRIKY